MVDYKLELIDAQGQKLKIDITGTDIQMTGNSFDMAVSPIALKALCETVAGIQNIITEFKLKEIKLEKVV